MPVDFFIDVRTRVVFTVAIGEFTLSDAVGHMDRLQADPHYVPTLNQIGDFRDVTRVDVSGFDIRRLAKRAVFHPDARRVLVIHKAIAYGLARMFTTLREMRGDTSLKIVRDLSEAADWVGIDPAHAAHMCEHVKERLRSTSPSD